jgi:hypothetical protein
MAKNRRSVWQQAFWQQEYSGSRLQFEKAMVIVKVRYVMIAFPTSQGEGYA